MRSPPAGGGGAGPTCDASTCAGSTRMICVLDASGRAARAQLRRRARRACGACLRACLQRPEAWVGAAGAADRGVST